jgi:hypothetical protein
MNAPDNINANPGAIQQAAAGANGNGAIQQVAAQK